MLNNFYKDHELSLGCVSVGGDISRWGRSQKTLASQDPLGLS